MARTGERVGVAAMGGIEDTFPRRQELYENRREREFYRYFEPIRSLTQNGPPLCDLDKGRDVGWRPSSSPDLALTAFCQLGALRLNCRRAMLFFFDKDYAYILAEATRSLSLLDNSIQDPDDGIWLGHSKIPRGYSVCEKTTVHCPNTKDIRDPNPGTDFLHIISDLRDDTTFCDRPFVKGAPFAKFYAGVPITSPRGINIGAYCVLDDKPRDGLEMTERTFLRHMSATVMDHLEGLRARAQHHRGNRMIDGLSAFVDGASGLGRGPNEDVLGTVHGRATATHMRNASLRKLQGTASSRGSSAPESRKSSTVKTPVESQSNPFVASPLPSPSPKTMSAKEVHASIKESRIPDLSIGSTTSRRSEEPATDPGYGNARKTFLRAASVLRNAVEADGVVFVDAAAISPRELDPLRRPTDDSSPSSDVASCSSDDQASEKDSNRLRYTARDVRSCDILAASVRGEDESYLEHSSPTSIRKKLLRRLLHKYQGKVWNLDGDGHTSSDDAHEPKGNTNRSTDALARKKNKKRAQARDGKQLAQLFPGARSLAIISLWDSIKNRWLAAGIIWSCDPFRILTEDFELPFLMAFSDVVVAEIHRLEAQKSDRAKMDFISSISHELRSPLHGILGSGECIQEQGTDEATGALVSQMIVCGKTLLDIVDHLLDYSKINFYGRTTQDNMRADQNDQQRRLSTAGLTTHFENAMSLDAEVCLSAITQEVVDTVYYSFCCSKDPQTILDRQVAMIMDVDQGSDVDWRCRIALGAWKRVIINLVGNALKYTTAGYIHVQLKQEGPNAVFIVRDSGNGMSKAFLHERLFSAFAQENSFAEGTGLGLHLVKSILKAINGSIEIESEQNVGTTVTVKVPLARTSQRLRSSASLETATEIVLPSKLTLVLPDALENMPSAAMDAKEKLRAAQALLVGSVAKSCSEMGIRTILATSGASNEADIQLFTEDQFQKQQATGSKPSPLLDAAPGSDERKVPLIVLCDTAMSLRKFRRDHADLMRCGRVELVSQPAGPDKILKAIRACLSKTEVAQGLTQTTSQAESEHIRLRSNVPLRAAAQTTEESQANDVARGKDIDRRMPGTTGPGSHSITTHLASGELDKSAQAMSLVKEIDLISDPKLSNGTTPCIDEAVIPAQQTKGAIRQPASPAAAAHSTNGLDLLLVDDNPINLQLLTTYSNKHSHRHTRALNGQQAVEAYIAACTSSPLPPHVLAAQSNPSALLPPNKPHAILLDINMPVLDGYEAARQIRTFEQRKGLPPTTIIALTGLGSASAQQEAYACGIDLFLTKPVKLKQLGKILETLGKKGEDAG